jgi:uncharacterized protein YutE (UPF0331/DUF86 family)
METPCRVMSEAGALPQAFAEELAAMAKFRNRRVHLYGEVDDRQVHALMQTRLGDLGRFLDLTASFLNA